MQTPRQTDADSACFLHGKGTGAQKNDIKTPKQRVNQPVTGVEGKSTDLAREDSLPVCGFKRFSFRRESGGDDTHSAVS